MGVHWIDAAITLGFMVLAWIILAIIIHFDDSLPTQWEDDQKENGNE